MAVAVLLIPAALGSSQTIFNDGDVSWHIATGQWILDHRAIPHADPFSFTWAGRPWVPIEWLAEVFYASAYRLAGYGGVAALVTAALMALHWIVYANATRFLRPWIAVATLVAMDVGTHSDAAGEAAPVDLAVARLVDLAVAARPRAEQCTAAGCCSTHGAVGQPSRRFRLRPRDCRRVRARGAGRRERQAARLATMAGVWSAVPRRRVHQRQRHRGRRPSAALYPASDAAADRRVEAVKPGQDAILLCRARVDGCADRVEAAAAALGSLAAAWRAACPRAASDASPGDGCDCRGDAAPARLRSRRRAARDSKPQPWLGRCGWRGAAGRDAGDPAAQPVG